MEQLKIYGFNAIALAFSISSINPILQAVSLLLAIAYTIISISKKLKWTYLIQNTMVMPKRLDTI
mgnify:CR=1 FL=1